MVNLSLSHNVPYHNTIVHTSKQLENVFMLSLGYVSMHNLFIYNFNVINIFFQKATLLLKISLFILFRQFVKGYIESEASNKYMYKRKKVYSSA